ncbi:hypothetical protein TrRE_jg5851 [Triparma retinervis]|uniref:Uncharacterized protein n=1 Tax=Triparma retinervis TaxID=2557542 RepID=A0A9W7CCB5_9STRA|nr:hypothetical protein TrRE_jg5851 [Triparma retinervis]
MSSNKDLFDDVSSGSSSDSESSVESSADKDQNEGGGDAAEAAPDDNLEVWEVKVPTSLLKKGVKGLGLGGTILLESGFQDRVGGGKVKVTHKPCTGPKFMLADVKGKGIRARKVDKTVMISIPPSVDMSRGVKGVVNGGYGQVEQDKTLRRRWKAIGDVMSDWSGEASSKATNKATKKAAATTTASSPKPSKKRKADDGGEKSAKKSSKKKKKTRKE